MTKSEIVVLCSRKKREKGAIPREKGKERMRLTGKNIVARLKAKEITAQDVINAVRKNEAENAKINRAMKTQAARFLVLDRIRKAVAKAS